VFCPKPATFEFLKGVFDELFDIFPSEYYHIGGDECPKESWKSCTHCQQLINDKGLKNEDELQSYFITEIEKYLNQHGKQIIGWDEILEGGVAPNATVMSWRGEAGGIAAASQKHQVIMSPNTYCYFDYSQLGGELDEYDFGRKRFLPLETVYHYEPYTEKLTEEQHQFIIGVQGNVWTEYMKTPERVAEQTFPRAFALSEVGWTLSANKNYDTFKTGVLQMFNRMSHWGMNYSQAFYEPIFYYDRRSSSYPKKLVIKIDLPNAELFYTTDGTDPTRQSTPYKKPLEVNKGDLIKTAAFVGKVQTGRTNTVKLN
jgi:hexosaminidase